MSPVRYRQRKCRHSCPQTRRLHFFSQQVVLGLHRGSRHPRMPVSCSFLRIPAMWSPTSTHRLCILLPRGKLSLWKIKNGDSKCEGCSEPSKYVIDVHDLPSFTTYNEGGNRFSSVDLNDVVAAWNVGKTVRHLSIRYLRWAIRTQQNYRSKTLGDCMLL